MSIERCFLLNQLADFSILAAVSRGFGVFRFRRVALAATLSALYGTLAALSPPLGSGLVQLALLLPLAMLTLGRTAVARATPLAASLAAAALAAGAFAQRAGGPAAAWVLLVPMAWGFQIQRRRAAAMCPEAEIEVLARGGVARFPAIVDTGNRLTEPLSGQPVLIAAAHLLTDVLPTTGYRRVAYGSLGGGGDLCCFRPERIYISTGGRRRRAPDAWIAVYPGRLPGGVRALAPAALAAEW